MNSTKNHKSTHNGFLLKAGKKYYLACLIFIASFYFSPPSFAWSQSDCTAFDCKMAKVTFSSQTGTSAGPQRINPVDACIDAAGMLYGNSITNANYEYSAEFGWACDYDISGAGRFPYQGWIGFRQDCPEEGSVMQWVDPPGEYGITPRWCGYCPQGTLWSGVSCTVGVTAYLPKVIPPPQTCSNPSAGNPIVISDGSKFERTENIYVGGNGALDFYFTYNNSNTSAASPWRHTFQKNIKVTDPFVVSTVRASSNTYTSKQDACFSGWNDIKVKIQDSWVAGATVRMNGDSCEIVSNGKVIDNLVFSIPMAKYPGSIQINRDDGSQVSYEYFGGEDFRSVSGDQGQLKIISAGGWQFSPSLGVIELYDSKGQLISITRNGQKQQLSYNVSSGALEKVDDLAGHSLTFAYTNNQLTSVTQENGKTTIYHYNTLGMIDKVTHPDITTRQYHYEDLNFPNALSGITDERGIRYATWKYDAQGRAISSEHANGTEKTQLSFNFDGSTTVTNALNKNTIYFFETIAGARRVVRVEGQPTTNCIGANHIYTYTPQGWRESKTDWAGNKTVYGYNAKGQETSRTEASGTPEARTITTEWHPILNLKTKVTESGKETSYTYDANGLLLNQTTRSLP